MYEDKIAFKFGFEEKNESVPHFQIYLDQQYINIYSLQVTKGFLHRGKHFQKVYLGFLKVYEPIIIFESFSKLMWILQMTSKIFLAN